MSLLRRALESYSDEDPIAKLANEVKTPEGLLKWMSRNVRYGYITNKGNVSFDFDAMDEEYRLQNPESVIETKVGVCWDQAELERLIFDIFEINNRCYHIETSPMQSTHTFIVFDKDEKSYWFENSFGKQRGIHGPFSSDMAIIKRVVEAMRTDLPKNKINYKFLYGQVSTKMRPGLSVNGYLSLMSRIGLKTL